MGDDRNPGLNPGPRERKAPGAEPTRRKDAPSEPDPKVDAPGKEESLDIADANQPLLPPRKTPRG